MLLETLLYRGDAEPVARFDVEKTSSRGLFGPGIYLTDDPEIAADYTLKGSPHVLHSDPEAKTQRELIAGYIRKLLNEVIDWKAIEKQLTQDWAVDHVKGHVRGQPLPGMSDGYWNRLRWFLDEHHKKLAEKRFPEVQAKFREIMPTLRIVRDTMGELSIVTRERGGSIATFDVPEDYLRRTLHAERPLPDNVLKMIRRLWFKEMGKTAHDMRDANENGVDFDTYVKNYKVRGTRYAWSDNMIGGKGENPTFDELRNGTHGGYYVFSDSLFDKAGRHARFVAAMGKLGYVGLEYQGGLRVGGYNRGGGGRLHRAFVFWHGDDLARYRHADTTPTGEFAHDPAAAKRHSFSRLYVPQSRMRDHG